MNARLEASLDDYLKFLSAGAKPDEPDGPHVAGA
jgi:hypothetical protein